MTLRGSSKFSGFVSATPDGSRWYPIRVAHEQQAEADRLNVPVAIEHEGTGIVLVLVPGGGFTMGVSPRDNDAFFRERPAHEVVLESFFLSVAPVTQQQWEAAGMGPNPSLWKDGDCPVVNVSWDDAHDFLGGLASCGLRLPTEAEWERGARAGTTTRYWWGHEPRTDMANCRGSGIDRITAVDHFAPNPWGLWDMSGNVLEWCEDRWGWGYYERSPTHSPVGPETGDWRVMRGGSWYLEAAYARVSYRDRCFPEGRFQSGGFRVALDVPAW